MSDRLTDQVNCLLDVRLERESSPKNSLSAVYLKYPPRKSLFPYNVTDGSIRTDKVIKECLLYY